MICTPRWQHPAISIHAPREGCDDKGKTYVFDGVVFQSTHPVRGATRPGYEAAWAEEFQSTHPVRGATAWACFNAALVLDFNPRTP